MVVSDHTNLFGPFQVSTNEAPGTFILIPTTSFNWIGVGASESSKYFGFSRGYAPVVMARLAVTWIPRGATIAIVKIPDGGTTTNVYEKQNSATTPVNDNIEFTGLMNAWIGQRVDQHIGFQMKGDGTSAVNLYGVRLEIEYEIGGRR